MKKFELLVEETSMIVYEIDAESEDEAVVKFQDGLCDSGHIVDSTVENIINVQEKE